MEADLEQVKEISRQIKKWKQHERQEYIHEPIDKDLDIADKWNVIRELKKTYKPLPYAIRDKYLRKVRVRDRAEAAAKNLEEEIWNNKETDPTKTKGEKVMKDKLIYNNKKIKMDELKQILKKIKRRN